MLSGLPAKYSIDPKMRANTPIINKVDLILKASECIASIVLIT